MTQQNNNDLWRDFPKTATEFEARFATEADCRAYWIEAGWGGKPARARCNSTRVWTERDGCLFECADCGHQTSLTSSTSTSAASSALRRTKSLKLVRAYAEAASNRARSSGLTRTLSTDVAVALA